MLVTPSEVIDAHPHRGRRRPHRSPGVQDGAALGADGQARGHPAPRRDLRRVLAHRACPSSCEERGEEGVASQDPEAQGEDMPQPQVAEGDEADADEDEEGIDMPLYSPVEVLAGTRLQHASSPTRCRTSRARSLIVARRLATRESRRYRSTQRGHAIDLRRTMRRNIKYGGTVVELAQEEAQDPQAEDRADLRRQPQHGHVQQVPAAVHLRAAEHARAGSRASCSRRGSRA